MVIPLEAIMFFATQNRGMVIESKNQGLDYLCADVLYLHIPLLTE